MVEQTKDQLEVGGILTRLAVMELGPDDTLVFLVSRPITELEADLIQEKAMELFPEHKHLILSSGVEVSVIRQT